MTHDDLFKLYKRVQQKDRGAEDLLIEEHRRVFPKSAFQNTKRGQSEHYRQELHTMYLHLTR